jgi:hypothetical protein
MPRPDEIAAAMAAQPAQPRRSAPRRRYPHVNILFEPAINNGLEMVLQYPPAPLPPTEEVSVPWDLPSLRRFATSVLAMLDKLEAGVPVDEQDSPSDEQIAEMMGEPVEVDRELCATCNGRGETPEKPGEPCAGCNGAGFVLAAQ